MAKFIPGSLGKVKGTIGQLVLYQRRGQLVARARPGKRRLKASAGQLNQQNKLRVAMELLSRLRKTIRLGYRERNTSMTALNRAAGNFIRCISQDASGGLMINYNQLKVADGPLGLLFEPVATRLPGNRFRIDWLPENYLSSGLSGSDRVCLLLYQADQAFACTLENAGRRADGTLNCSLPASFSALTFHCWLFVCAACGPEVSSSIYLGAHSAATS